MDVMKNMWKVRSKCPNRERLGRLQGCVEGVGEDGDFRVVVSAILLYVLSMFFTELVLNDSK